MAKLTGKAKAKFLARMKKGRKAAKKSGGGKKKNSSRKKLEQRIEDLEIFYRELKEAKQMGTATESDLRELDYRKDTLDLEKKKLDCGDW